MRKGLYTFFIIVFFLSGCARTNIIDKIIMITVFGFDLAEDGQILGSALYPDYTQSKGDDKIGFLEEKAHSPVLIIPKMSEHTSGPVKISKIRVIIFGREIAEKGISELVERLIMEPELSTNIQVAVAEKSANELIKTFRKEKSLTLQERLRHNIQSRKLPEINLHYFLNAFFGEGMDAYIPMIDVDKREKVHITGLAIFKDDKLELTLNRNQTLIFNLLKDRRIPTVLEISPNENANIKDIIFTEIFNMRKKWKWNPKEERLTLNFTLQLFLTQYPNKFNSNNINDIKKLEAYIKKQLQKEMEDLLTLFKKHGVDPIGIGNICRSQDRNWNKEEFYTIYPHLPIDIHLKVEVIHSGLEG